jgi:hypothetical protein
MSITKETIEIKEETESSEKKEESPSNEKKYECRHTCQILRCTASFNRANNRKRHETLVHGVPCTKENCEAYKERIRNLEIEKSKETRKRKRTGEALLSLSRIVEVVEITPEVKMNEPETITNIATSSVLSTITTETEKEERERKRKEWDC